MTGLLRLYDSRMTRYFICVQRLTGSQLKCTARNQKKKQKSNENNKSSLCSASFLGYEHDTARICCCALSIDTSCPRDAQQQTGCTLQRLSNDGTDSRKDGRTDVRPLHRPCSTYYVGTVKHSILGVVKRP